MQDDGEQHRIVAYLACNLVHSLLLGQADGSDGPDAAHNTEFMHQLMSSHAFVRSLLMMCKHGRLESRHGALAVLQLFLVPQIWHSLAHDLRFQLMAWGAVPMLFDTAVDPHSSAELQTMAVTCLGQFDGNMTANSQVANFGTTSLPALLISWSLRETSEARSQDQRHK